MRLRLISIVSVLSLAICAGACATWVRSYRVTSHIIVYEFDGSASAPPRQCALWAMRGDIVVSDARPFLDGGLPQEWRNATFIWGDQGNDPRALTVIRTLCKDNSQTHLLGIEWGDGRFIYEYTTPSGAISFSIFAVPIWMVCMGSALLPAFRMLRMIAMARRRRRGGCRVCGYDLRATPGRCPECGTKANRSDFQIARAGP
jgi:hypothetical protein